MSDDPHDLTRFVEAREGVYEQALAEIRGGRKRSHWMWFVFPQLDGLGSSPMARRYAIKAGRGPRLTWPTRSWGRGWSRAPRRPRGCRGRRPRRGRGC
ncbi:MAG TPA: DUF1810 family protein [Gemmataceae bacterium]|nr:DUF1810 family protein [Gemmataceae bacterium]